MHIDAEQNNLKILERSATILNEQAQKRDKFFTRSYTNFDEVSKNIPTPSQVLENNSNLSYYENSLPSSMIPSVNSKVQRAARDGKDRSNSGENNSTDTPTNTTDFVTASQKLSQTYSLLESSKSAPTTSSSLSYYSASESVLTFRSNDSQSKPRLKRIQKPHILLEDDKKTVKVLDPRVAILLSANDSAGFSSPDCVSSMSLGESPKAVIRKIREETEELEKKSKMAICNLIYWYHMLLLREDF